MSLARCWLVSPSSGWRRRWPLRTTSWFGYSFRHTSVSLAAIGCFALLCQLLRPSSIPSKHLWMETDMNPMESVKKWPARAWFIPLGVYHGLSISIDQLLWPTWGLNLPRVSAHAGILSDRVCFAAVTLERWSNGAVLWAPLWDW